MVHADEIAKLTKPAHPDDWTELDTKAVDTARLLAADAVQRTGTLCVRRGYGDASVPLGWNARRVSVSAT